MKAMDYFRLAVLAVLFFLVLSFVQGGLSPFWSNARLVAAFASWGLLVATLWHRQKDEKKAQQKWREEFLETWVRPPIGKFTSCPQCGYGNQVDAVEIEPSTREKG